MRIGLAFALAVSGTLAGCGLPSMSDFGNVFTREVAPTQIAQPRGQTAAPATSAPGLQPGVIEVVNSAAGPLDMVFITACGAAPDGANRLAPGIRIPPGGRRQFSVAPGCWNVDAGISGVGQARQQLNVQTQAISRYTVTG